MRSGSAVQACCSRVVPSSPQLFPASLCAVSRIRRFPARAVSGSGYGVCMTQMPPSAVAAIRYRSSSVAPSPCQDWALTWTPMPSDRPRSYRFDSGTRPETAE
jgi:hypothetical protein